MIDFRQDPKTTDGKPILLINLFPGNTQINYPGQGDDITAGARHTGTAFEYTSVSAGETDIAWQFIEWVYLAGGEIRHIGAKLGDWISYRIHAPATVGTSVTAGTGNHAKIDTGLGFSMWVPAGTPGAGSADWDIDLTETLNANVAFTKVNPVPDSNNEGMYDWDAETNAVTLNPGKGAYNLFDADIPLTEFVSRTRLLGTGIISLTVPAVKPKRILPHWKHAVKINHVGTDQLDIVWYLYTARKITT